MTKTGRHLTLAVVASAILTTPRTVAAADDVATLGAAVNEAMPGASSDLHVRSDNPAIVALIRQANAQSATFHHLLEIINASDAIVFVQEGHCGRGVRACFIAVTVAGARRAMWVLVDTRKADWDLMGSIGHELRHTIEVINEPSVASTAAMYFLYSAIGFHGRTKTFETMAAVDAGNTVRSEVRASIRRAKAESMP
jgi:hypothetical protein